MKSITEIFVFILLINLLLIKFNKANEHSIEEYTQKNCEGLIKKRDLIVSIINKLGAKDKNPLNATETLTALQIYFAVFNQVEDEIANCVKNEFISTYDAAAKNFDFTTFFNDINVLCKHILEMKDFIDSKLDEVKQIAGENLFENPHLGRYMIILRTAYYYDSKLRECVQKTLRFSYHKKIPETVNLFK
uniref:Uncharacterized protein n=1 Tax=Strongyloides papillosus TaxID=174720 RepID=A0A0N5C2M9_STREA